MNDELKLFCILDYEFNKDNDNEYMKSCIRVIIVKGFTQLNDLQAIKLIKTGMEKLIQLELIKTTMKKVWSDGNNDIDNLLFLYHKKSNKQMNYSSLHNLIQDGFMSGNEKKKRRLLSLSLYRQSEQKVFPLFFAAFVSPAKN